ncbi:MAG: alpha-ketoglutarate-dependent dioxygenase AlkB [Cytophagia bacterium]|nr:MAG: alpha-ketoglutarate-dependent dioxygenase AlkB [Cytophagia bacterium]
MQIEQSSTFDVTQISENVSISNPKTLNDTSLLSNIKGFFYIPEYITQEEHTFLWQNVSAEKWLDDLKRRVQHYGYKYNYKTRFIDYTMKIGELPSWITSLAKKLKDDGFMQNMPDQLIINEYLAGQGIANHVDCEPCFGDTIVSLSLGSTCIMDFINKYTKEKIEALLEPRSLVILKDEARYDWTHGIKGKKTDFFKNQKHERNTRISLTFRNIILK